MLYWLSFQARFAYERNMAALQAAAYRRKIAGLLTWIWQGGGSSCVGGDLRPWRIRLVTEYVPGQKAGNAGATRSFLARVSRIFATAGLSIWQVNTRNPHAHTNLIRTPDGAVKTIDLESAVVTLVLAGGQWRSALRGGNIPVFDDIDFPRLRHYIAANAEALGRSLGPDGLAELKDAVARREEAIRTWKGAEPRFWGRIISRVCRLLDWSPISGTLWGRWPDLSGPARLF